MTPARNLRSASGMPSFSYVAFISSGSMSQSETCAVGSASCSSRCRRSRWSACSSRTTSSIGLRSKRFSALRRNFVIHSGSDLWYEMSRTTCSFRPFLGVNDVALGVVPPELVLAQIDALDSHRHTPPRDPGLGAAGAGQGRLRRLG